MQALTALYLVGATDKMGNLTATPMELNPLARLPPVEMLSRQSSKLCLSHGGLCVADGQCPAGQLTEKADTCEQAGTICCHARQFILI